MVYQCQQVPLTECRAKTEHGFGLLNHQLKPKLYSSSTQETYMDQIGATHNPLDSTSSKDTLNQAVHFSYNSDEFQSTGSSH